MNDYNEKELKEFVEGLIKAYDDKNKPEFIYYQKMIEIIMGAMEDRL